MMDDKYYDVNTLQEFSHSSPKELAASEKEHLSVTNKSDVYNLESTPNHTGKKTRTQEIKSAGNTKKIKSIAGVHNKGTINDHFHKVNQSDNRNKSDMS